LLPHRGILACSASDQRAASQQRGCPGAPLLGGCAGGRTQSSCSGTGGAGREGTDAEKREVGEGGP